MYGTMLDIVAVVTHSCYTGLEGRLVLSDKVVQLPTRCSFLVYFYCQSEECH